MTGVDSARLCTAIHVFLAFGGLSDMDVRHNTGHGENDCRLPAVGKQPGKHALGTAHRRRAAYAAGEGEDDVPLTMSR